MKVKMMKSVSLILVVFMVIGIMCGCSTSLSVDEATERYKDLLDSQGSMSNDEVLAEMAEIFEGISKGDKSNASEYASLAREILHDSFEFSDEEIFSVAENVSEVYSAFSDGRAGVQGISADNRDGVLHIVIEHLGCDKYSLQYVTSEAEPQNEDYRALGKNLIEITLLSTDVSDKLKEKYNTFQVYELNDSMKFMICPDIEHTTHIYIGSDAEFDITPCTLRSVRPYGEISIALPTK